MAIINTITIARIGSHKTVKFAANELVKYFRMMEPNAVVDTRIYDDYDEKLTDVIWLGISPAFDSKLPKVRDKKLDDAILIDIVNFSGVISGVNERSVLIAAYRFLRELGVAWIRPGQGEELVPKRLLDRCDVKICEAASYRYRNVCIEGANSYQHVYNMIDWIPKAGMNGYLIQFFMPFAFFNRWYGHEHNQTLDWKQITYDDVEHILRKIVEDIDDRSLEYHAVGHGWTSDPFGLVTGSWQKYEEEIPENIRNHLALVNGKREFTGGVPMNTQLCYSDPVAVDKMCQYAVSYCKNNPTVSHLYFWLADGQNNQCECEKCRDQRPADLYVQLLNRLDEVLSENNLDVKIVFIIYTDVMWAPLKEKFNNPDRFVGIFAPITRNYCDSYLDMDLENLETPPAFVRNHITLPNSVPQSMALLRDWQNTVEFSDAMIFEYHAWTSPNYDITRMELAKLIFRDIQALEKMGLSGYTSCQVQRHGFPNNILMESMATALWNKNANFDEMVERYMKNCYGKEYQIAKEYLENISKRLYPGVEAGFEGLKNLSNAQRKQDSEEALEITLAFREKTREILEKDQFEYPAQKKSWEYILIQTGISERLSKIYIQRFSDESIDKVMESIRDLAGYFMEIEPEVHNALDVWRTRPQEKYPYFLKNSTSNF